MRSLVLALLLLSAGIAAANPADDAIAAHYAAWLPLHPLDATDLGLHRPELDGALPELGAEAKILAELDQAQRALEQASKARGCDNRCQLDLQIVLSYIAAERAEHLEERPFARYADHAPDLVAGALFPLIKRNFAPLEDRARYAIARLSAAPKLLTEALSILDKAGLCTRVSIDIALEQIEDTAGFLDKDVPAAFDSLRDKALRKQVGEAGKRAADALRAYGKSLRTLRPRSREDFALGEKLFRRLLESEEQITEPLPQLLERGEAELHRLQAELKSVAKRLDPGKDPRALKDELGRDHAPAQALLADVRSRLGKLRAFVIDHDLVKVPAETLPTVDETPPFMRATTQASMDTPGAYEEKATEAYYHITLPDPSWDARRTEDYLAGAFNRSLADVVSIHEAVPGHYLQHLWIHTLARQARRMQGNGANVEGWAHYCEEMMLDEGWGREAPSATRDRLRIAQLSDALLRAARYVVAIRMHTGGMTLAQAERFFEEEGFQSHEVARIESKRGTGDPMFLHYTWGKLELKRLRDELRARWGKTFTLRRFHDAVLGEGPIPLPLLRRALLGG